MKPMLFLLLMSALPLQAQFTYAPVNVPGALYTVARGINNNGLVVGMYGVMSCTNYDRNVPNCPTKGFKLVNGSYIKLMVPGSYTTAIMGVNDLGDLVGFYSQLVNGCAVPVYHGFIWYHTNVVKTIDAPGTDFCGTDSGITVATGINKAGTVVGGIWSFGPSGTFAQSGWVWVNGTFQPMNPQAPGSAAPCCWSVNGISNSGIISGQVFQSDFNMAWLKEAADEDFYEYFTAPANGGDTYGTGVDSATDVIGFASQAGGFFAKHIELNEGTNDAVEVHPGFLPVKYPGAQFTIPFGINDSRYLAGTYYDPNGGQHGFIAKPNF